MSRITRCKLQLQYKAEPDPALGPDALVRIMMGAVWSPDPCEENGMFGKATPYASFSFNAVSSSVAQMEQGKEYYVDITLAE